MRERLDQRDLEAELAGAGRHLRADEAGADHRHARTPRQLGAQRERVVEAAQQVDAGERGRSGQGSRARAGGDHESVVREALAAGERDAARGEIEAARLHAEAQIEAQRIEGLRLGQRELLRLAVAAQHFLRERRAVVGAMRLVAHQHEPAVEALTPQRFGAAEPGQGSADHDDGFESGHQVPGLRGRTPYRRAPASSARARRVQRSDCIDAAALQPGTAVGPAPIA